MTVKIDITDCFILDEDNKLREKVIGAAIAVRRHLGPGLLESTYETCLNYELELLKLKFERQVSLPITYKDTLIVDSGYRIVFLIENKLILEIKSEEKVLPVLEAQLLTYMKLSKIKLGLLINFNVKLQVNGIHRIII